MKQKIHVVGQDAFPELGIPHVIVGDMMANKDKWVAGSCEHIVLSGAHEITGDLDFFLDLVSLEGTIEIQGQDYDSFLREASNGRIGPDIVNGVFKRRTLFSMSTLIQTQGFKVQKASISGLEYKVLLKRV